MSLAFETLGLLPQLVQVVEEMGFEQPTPIQQAAIPALLSGRNVVGQAQTGTGKTAAFALPMLQKLLEEGKQPGKAVVRALLMAPTRELAIQVAEATGKMAQNSGLRVLAVYGGQPYHLQVRQLERGVDIVVGTPGRLLDLMRQEVLKLSQVRYLVLDEADEMLDMGFMEDVEAILAQIPAERQIALFSATLPAPVRKLADKYVSDPERIAINPTHMTVAETEQRLIRVREENKFEALTRLLEVEEVKSALIFARTKARAQELADTLIERGYPAESLHGDLSQSRREFVLNRFRQGSITLLVATDVAARGLDIENVSHVFNYDVPGDAEDYVHRIGRTGRAGRKGIAITFLHPHDRRRLAEIEAYTRQKIGETRLPTREEIQARRDDRFIQRMYEMLIKETPTNELAMVTRMLDMGVDLADLAAAAIQMARAGESSLPVGDINEPSYEPRYARRKTGAGQGAEDGKYPRSRKPFDGEKSQKTWRKDAPVQAQRRDTVPPAGDAGQPRREKRHEDRHEESGMVRLVMNLGDAHGLRPGDVVGAIASEVGIPGRAIGAIDIHHNHTFVDVSEKHVREVLKASTGQYLLRGKPVMLTVVS
jgi:ATP-dependent RNA helicase DeaD